MIVRDATAADLDAVAALQRPSFPEDPWTRAMLAQELERPGGIFLAAADEEGHLLGFAIGAVAADELSVFQVAVAPRARRVGAGRALMRALHAAARLQAVAWLEVRADNAAALGLYAALGYVAVSLRRRYYPDGCDAVVMRCELPGG